MVDDLSNLKLENQAIMSSRVTRQQEWVEEDLGHNKHCHIRASVIVSASGAWSAQRTLLDYSTAIRRVRCADLRGSSGQMVDRMIKAQIRRSTGGES